MRKLVLLATVAALVTFAPLTSALAEDLLASGQTGLLTIDGNGDGPGPGDCVLSATRNLGAVTINTAQDTSLALVLCALTLSGNSFEGSDSSSDFFGVDVTSSVPAAGSLPLRVEFVDEQRTTPNGLPAMLDDPLPTDGVFVFDLIDPMNPNDQGLGTLCSASAGAIALKGTDKHGVSFLFDAGLYPNATAPTHLRIPSLPFQPLASPSTRVLRNAYVPVNANKTLTLAGSDNPNALLISIDLSNLPFCGSGKTAAPSLTVWGLVAMMTMLLVVGTWSVGRRRGFYRSLTLP